MENTNTVVVPTNNVEGNITNCRIEQQLTRVDRDSAVSLTQINHYVTYDVCSKKIIDQYAVQEVTAYGHFFTIPVFLVALLVPFAIWVIFASINDKRKGTFGNFYNH